MPDEIGHLRLPVKAAMTIRCCPSPSAYRRGGRGGNTRLSSFIKSVQHFADGALVVVEAATGRKDVKVCRIKVFVKLGAIPIIMGIFRILDNPQNLLVARNSTAILRRTGASPERISPPMSPKRMYLSSYRRISTIRTV